MRIIVDAYAWIEIFIGSEKGEKAKETIEKASEIYTPDIVLAEVARKYLRDGMSREIVVNRLRTITEASDILSINTNITIEAAECHMSLLDEAKGARLKNPSLFDAIVLATSRLLEGTILTGDEHFKNLPETTWIG